MSNIAVIGGARFLAAIRRPIIKTVGIAFILGAGSGALITSQCPQKAPTKIEELRAGGTFDSIFIDAYKHPIEFYKPRAKEIEKDAKDLAKGYTKDWFSGILVRETALKVDGMMIMFSGDTELTFRMTDSKTWEVMSGVSRYPIDSARYGLIPAGNLFFTKSGHYQRQPETLFDGPQP